MGKPGQVEACLQTQTSTVVRHVACDVGAPLWPTLQAYGFLGKVLTLEKADAAPWPQLLKDCWCASLHLLTFRTLSMLEEVEGLFL